MVMSYNVRGLNKEKKLRHIINHLYKKDPGKTCDFVACLQETYQEKDGLIPYLWRGSYHLTPGLGNRQGCITCPNPNNVDKLNFFEQVFEAVSEAEQRHNCLNTIILGDFNLAFKLAETKNRMFTTQEQRMATAVK